MQPPPHDISAQIARMVRADWGRILAALVKSLGDFALAEDSLQDAALEAMAAWAERGLPDAPDAWLITVARRKALDRLRRDANFARKSAEIAYLQELEVQADPADAMEQIPDKRLELIFTCCHPAIEEKSRIALTLRALGGLGTDEIAAAFLDKPETMAARLTRAKTKIKAAGIPFVVPGADELGARLDAVLRVIYLVFNEGYRATSGQDLMRADLIAEATRLARVLRTLMPKSEQVAGLLALILLHDSRRFARLDAQGGLVPLREQNRARWDKSKIREGRALVKEALQSGPPSPFALQAAISALHAESPGWNETDWPQIVALYDALWQLEPTSVVRVNQAVALSFAKDADTALAFLTRHVDPREVAPYQPYHVALSDLLLRAGQRAAARAALAKAVELTHQPEERAYLLAQAPRYRDA